MSHARLSLALLLGLLGCSASGACPPATLADIQYRHAIEATDRCDGYVSLAECPYADELAAKRDAEEMLAGCR